MAQSELAKVERLIGGLDRAQLVLLRASERVGQRHERLRTCADTGEPTYAYAGGDETVLRIANSGGTTLDAPVDVAGTRLGVRVGTSLASFVPDLHVGQRPPRYDGHGVTLAVAPTVEGSRS